MSRRVFILGSTGSIGRSTLEVLAHLRARDGAGSWPLIGLSARSSASQLLEQAVALGAEAISIEIETELDFDCVYASADSLLRKHAKKGDLVVAAIVGFAGISPVLTAIDCGCDIALANKEALVAAGAIVMEAVKKSGVTLLPIDSEHSAIFQALSNHKNCEVAKLTLTASGGSLREMPTSELANATVKQVLQHPTWSMGDKVTVDSASLMNKALELIEAHWLFGVSPDRLEAIIHPQSIVHGMVEFVDGSVIAQLSTPDMKIPIQFALTWPKRLEGCSETVDWSQYPSLQFEKIDLDRYPAIRIAYEVMRLGGTAGAVCNAANEVVVESFLASALPFGSMVAIVEEVLSSITLTESVTLENVTNADAEARELARSLVVAHKVNS